MRDHVHDGDESTHDGPDHRRTEESTQAQVAGATAGRPEVLRPDGVLALQRSAGNAAVAGLLSGGGALGPDLRGDMEGRLGHDFGDVRVHSGSEANAAAASMDAQAYTIGSDIVLGNGVDLESPAGQHTLAHELTHVVQQRSGPVEGTDIGGGVMVSDPDDRFEREAAATANRAMSH